MSRLDPTVAPLWFADGAGRRRTLLSPEFVLTCTDVSWRRPRHLRRTVYVRWWLHALSVDETGVTETEVASGSATAELSALAGARLLAQSLPRHRTLP